MDLVVYAVLIGLVALVGLPHLAVVWIKGAIALRRNAPYVLGFFDGGLFAMGKTTSAKKMMGWSLAGWTLAIGLTAFACGSRWAGWMNGSCESVMPERAVRAVATGSLSLAYDEDAFRCTATSRGLSPKLDLTVAAAEDTLEQRADALADRALDERGERPAGKRARPTSTWSLQGDERVDDRRARRAKPERLADATLLLELPGERVILHTRKGVVAELHLSERSFDRAAAITLATTLEKNEVAMDRYAPRAGSTPKGGRDAAKAWDDAHRARDAADTEPTSPLVGVAGAAALFASLALVGWLVRRAVLARRRAEEALHSTRGAAIGSL